MMIPTNLVSRIRRNHALEHATIHLLSDKFKHFGAQGNATPAGYYLNIYGEVPPAAISAAAHEALERMKNGEHQLALHPNCGTVHLTMAAAATLAAQGTFVLEQKRLGKEKADGWSFLNTFPTAVLAVVFALIAARPLGMYFQSFTTNGQPGTLEIEEVRQVEPTAVARFFRVLLGQDKRIRATSYFIATTG